MMNLVPRGMSPNQTQPSPEFVEAVQVAQQRAASSQDDQARYMVGRVPVYAQVRPTHAQTVAGGCQSCVYLGLWADTWPGYPSAPHGIVWLFEEGIRSRGGDLCEQTLATLLHEFDHVLQRDHVLQAMNRQKIAAMSVQARGCRGC